MAAIAQAFPAWACNDTARLAQLNDWVRHTRESGELRLQTEQMGRSLVEWLKNRYAADTAAQTQVQWLAAQDASYPMAFALAAHLTGANARDALLAYAFGWAENMVQAAIKAVPLGRARASASWRGWPKRFLPQPSTPWHCPMPRAKLFRPCWPFCRPGMNTRSLSCPQLNPAP